MTDIAEISPNLGLPFYQTKLNEFEVQHNEALLVLDALVMLAVIDRDLSAPPSSPTFGDRYLVKATGTGDFAGKDNRIAQYDIGGWNFYAPQEGWTCYVRDEHTLLAWNGASWEAALDVLGGISEIQELNLLGIGTTADSTNRLSAKLNNVLWTAKTDAEGGDGTLRYKLSKESAAKTLSLLFQDNFSGRAEIGLTGDDDFHFKTSPDGSSWIDALTLDKTTGAAKLNSAVYLTGDISPSQITSDQNDYNPAGLATAAMLRLSTDASRNLTGLAGGADGRIATIVNVGANALVLKDASTSPSAANRFALGVDVTLSGNQSALLWYDATNSRWKMLAGPHAGGSVPADLDITLAELALGLADATNVAQFLGGTGNRFADSFDALTYVDTAGATNLDSSTAGLLKPTVSGVTAYANGGGNGDRTSGGNSVAVTVGGGISLAGGTAGKFVNGSTSNESWLTGGSSAGYIQFDFGSGHTKYITEITWKQDGIADQGQFKLQGSNDGSSFTDVTAAFAVNPGSSATAVITVTWIVAPALYRYYRLAKTGTGTTSSAMFVQEIEFKIDSALPMPGNMTVKSAALTAAATPASMKIVALVEEIDSVTLGTDLIFAVSRDGGTTFTNATMSDRFTSSSIHVLETTTAVDVSGQPSGTSVKWRITTANNKMVKIHGIYVYWA